MEAAKATIRSDYGPNPNGAKLYTAGMHRRHPKRPRREGSRQPSREPQQRHNHLSARNFGLPSRNTTRHRSRNDPDGATPPRNRKRSGAGLAVPSTPPPLGWPWPDHDRQAKRRQAKRSLRQRWSTKCPSPLRLRLGLADPDELPTHAGWLRSDELKAAQSQGRIMGR